MSLARLFKAGLSSIAATAAEYVLSHLFFKGHSMAYVIWHIAYGIYFGADHAWRRGGFAGL
jgi:hypothetical protein